MERLVFGSTDKGLVRTSNQDRFLVQSLSKSMSFAVLCDGMGGENGGNIASEMAVEFAGKVLTRDLSHQMTELSIRAVFSSIFSGSNALIHDAALKDTKLKGMGTTMILAVAKDNQLYIGTVGDSRVYLASKTREVQLTKDHTVVQMMVDLGEISQKDALYHPKRHFITRAVGVSDTVEMDFIVETLAEGDQLLLCSDGLYGYLKAGKLFSLLSRCVEEKSASSLITLAKAGGGSDNITAIVMV